MTYPVRIATRGSPLALAQAHEVKNRLRSAHAALAADDAIEIRTYKTTGDRILSQPLAEIGGKGLFTKEIEEALLDGSADIAVHSMKDVPTELPDGLVLETLLPREDPRDALISLSAKSIVDLPMGARVGTGSLRRRAILLSARPDLRIEPLRGNVGTRLDRIRQGDFDATLLAVAGLNRLGMAGAETKPIDPDDMLPATCQGAIGIECREGDQDTRTLLAALNHSATAICIAAERAFLGALDGSCRTPIAGLATLSGDCVSLRGLIVRPDGSETLAAQDDAPSADAALLGRTLGEALRGRAGPGFFDETP
jgi:hydroxymethylbilane synthase